MRPWSAPNFELTDPDYQSIQTVGISYPFLTLVSIILARTRKTITFRNANHSILVSNTHSCFRSVACLMSTLYTNRVPYPGTPMDVEASSNSNADQTHVASLERSFVRFCISGGPSNTDFFFPYSAQISHVALSCGLTCIHSSSTMPSLQHMPTYPSVYGSQSSPHPSSPPPVHLSHPRHLHPRSPHHHRRIQVRPAPHLSPLRPILGPSPRANHPPQLLIIPLRRLHILCGLR